MSGKAVRETLAALGVIASLVFVGMEIRQGTAVARIAAAQTMAEHQLGLNQVLISETMTDLNARLLAGDSREAFAPVEQLQLDATHLSVLRTWESLYTVVNEGIVDSSVLEGMSQGLNPFGAPYVRESWPIYRGSFTEDFATYVETTFDLAP
jgi:hypothetical protein